MPVPCSSGLVHERAGRDDPVHPDCSRRSVRTTSQVAHPPTSRSVEVAVELAKVSRSTRRPAVPSFQRQ